MKSLFSIKIFNKLNTRLLVISFLIFFGYFYSTPYLSIFFFKTAIENRQSRKANKYINFSSLRSDLKSQLTNNLRNKALNKYRNRLSPFSLTLINPVFEKMVDSIVDYTVTNNGLRLLLNKGQLLTDARIYQDQWEEEDIKVNLYYQGLNIFILSTKVNNLSQPIKTYWLREGLFHWKLSRIDLPPELIQ